MRRCARIVGLFVLATHAAAHPPAVIELEPPDNAAALARLNARLERDGRAAQDARVERIKLAFSDRGQVADWFREGWPPAILKDAQGDPELLWEFLTAPETPYRDRINAAYGAWSVLPPEYLFRIIQASQDARAARFHSGVRSHPANALESFDSLVLVPRRFKVFGHEWRTPDEPIEHPLTQEELEASPWPWQVFEALTAAERAARSSLSSRSSEVIAIEMALPLESEDDADRLVRVCEVIGTEHFDDLILRRVHRLAMSERFPMHSRWILSSGGGWERLGVADADAIINAFFEDVIRNCPHPESRQHAAFVIRHFPEAYAAILAAGDRAMDPRTGLVDPWSTRSDGDWVRYYCYMSAVAKLRNAPIQFADRVDPDSEIVCQRIDQFEHWYRRDRPLLESLAAQQREQIDAARSRLGITR